MYLFGITVVFLSLVVFIATQDEVFPVTEAQSEATDVSTDVICNTCDCADGVVNCTSREIKEPFTAQDWNGLKALQVTKVDLSQNLIKSLTRLTTLPIQILNASYCEIGSIQDIAFVNLDSLLTLDLSHNKLLTSSLNRRIFAGHMTSNEGFQPLSITYLSLAYNDIHSLPQDVFSFLKRLDTLDLSGNPLGFIDQLTMAAISELVELKELRLSSCELETLPDGLFRRLRRLQRLTLSDNKFSTVPTVIGEATNLVYLSFCKNSITTLEEKTVLSNLSRLEEFRLCRNSKLQSISANALGGLQSLSSLDLSFNPRLTYLDPDFLVWENDHDVEMWPSLNKLLLNNNNLTTIDSGLLDRWTQLREADFSNNPYVCNCSSQWMVDVLTPLVIALNFSADEMICKKPQDLRGMTFAQLSSASKILTCSESENMVDLPGADMAIILGIMIGIFVTFPLVLVVVLLWKKGYFARCRARKDDRYSDEECETDAF